MAGRETLDADKHYLVALELHMRGWEPQFLLDVFSSFLSPIGAVFTVLPCTRCSAVVKPIAADVGLGCVQLS